MIGNLIAIGILAYFIGMCVLITADIQQACRDAQQVGVGSASSEGTSVHPFGETDAGSLGPRLYEAHGLSSVAPESTRGSLPDNQEGRYGGRDSSLAGLLDG